MTIATNMAGRGTDIVLGGNLEAELAGAAAETERGDARRGARSQWQERHDQVIAAGGLHIIGTERHESRRIDNQLRGRSGRQGDPGSSRFYLSMEDNLMRIFGDPKRTKRLLQMAGMKAGEVIESGMLTRQIEKAQRKVESHNFDIRKQLLLFDDVANDQRKVVYQQRTEIMGTEDLSAAIAGIREEAIGTLIDQFMPNSAAPQDWDLKGLREALAAGFRRRAWTRRRGWPRSRSWRRRSAARSASSRRSHAAYEAKVARSGAAIMRHVEKDVMLRTLDQHWREHLARDGLPAPGHPSARLCAEGLPLRVQARGLRAVRGDARARQVRHRVDAVEARDPHPGGSRPRGGGAARAPDARTAGAARRGAVRAARPRAAAGCAGRARRRGIGTAAPRRRVGLAPRVADAARAPATFVRAGAQGRPQRALPCGSGKKFKHCHGVLSECAMSSAERAHHARGGGGAVRCAPAGS